MDPPTPLSMVILWCTSQPTDMV